MSTLRVGLLSLLCWSGCHSDTLVLTSLDGGEDASVSDGAVGGGDAAPKGDQGLPFDYHCGGDEDCATATLCCARAPSLEYPVGASFCGTSCTVRVCHDNTTCGGGTCEPVNNVPTVKSCNPVLKTNDGLWCTNMSCANASDVCCSSGGAGACSAAASCAIGNTIACEYPGVCAPGSVCCVTSYDGSADVTYAAKCITAAECDADTLGGRRLCIGDTNCRPNEVCVRETSLAREAHCAPK